MKRRNSPVWFVMITLQACSLSAQPLHNVRTAANRQAQATRESTRHWWFEGETKSNAGFIRSITLLVLRENGRLSGSYYCGSGVHSNAACRNLDDRGEIIDGSIKGSRLTLRVRLFGDNSTCIYFGTLAVDYVDGSYICYQVASVVERGTWHARDILSKQEKLP